MDNQKNNQIVSLLIGPIFLAFALLFYLTPKTVHIPLAAEAKVDLESLSTKPLRQPLSNPPLATINGYKRDCMDCHMLFTAKVNGTIRAGKHDEIVMNHGMNAECINCHAIENRNLLALRFGKTTTFDNVDQLCAKCHGPTFRDWQQGTHGKTLGHWNHNKASSHKLTCTECHDPHAPAFGTLKPLPHPTTLRMGDQSEHLDSHGDEGDRNPLRTWSGVSLQDGPSEQKSIAEYQELP